MSALEKIQKKLKEENKDGIILTSYPNRFYATGFASSDGTVLILQEKAYLMVDFRYIEAAREKVSDFEVVLSYKNPFSMCYDLLVEQKKKTVGLEEQTLSYAQYVFGENRLEGMEVFPASSWLNTLRMVKEEKEVAAIAKGQKLNEEAFLHILPYIKEGVLERELAAELEYYLRKNGAEGLAFDTIVLTGKNTAKPHGVPGDTPVRFGDFVLFDFGCRIDGYCSDMTRTVAYGQASQEMKEVYESVLSAQKTALAGIRAGLTGEQCDALARDVLEKRELGHAFGHSLGHSVGLVIHESPNFSPSAGGIIPAGAVVSVEPGAYLEGKFGVRIEDLVFVTENGIKNLNTLEKELIILEK